MIIYHLIYKFLPINSISLALRILSRRHKNKNIIHTCGCDAVLLLVTLTHSAYVVVVGETRGDEKRREQRHSNIHGRPLLLPLFRLRTREPHLLRHGGGAGAAGFWHRRLHSALQEEEVGVRHPGLGPDLIG